MTGPEREDLRLALDFLRDWRREDAEWKQRIGERVGHLEDRFVALDALAKAEADRLQRRFFKDERRSAVIGVIGFGIGALGYALANGFFHL